MKHLHRASIAALAALMAAACQMGAGGGESPAATASAVNTSTDQTMATAYEPAPLPDLLVGQRPSPETDEAGMWLVFDRQEQQSRHSANLITDPDLNAYVRDVVCKIAGPYCRDIRVYIGRVPHFNASMAPNGMMVVWTGFLLRARNEAQLAAVLGHEIGHYLRRHSVQRWRSTINTAGFLTFFSMGMGVAGLPGAGDLAALVAMGGLSSFGRDHEREADAIGLEKISAAGYDPREASAVWKNLIEENERASKEREFNFFLSTHPRDTERQETLATQAKAVIGRTGRTGDVGTERYRAAIASHRFQMLRDEIRLRDFKRNLAIVDMLIEDGFRLGELHYFRGEIFRLRDSADENDRDAALAEYAKAAAFADCPPDLFRSLGLLNHRMGRTGDASQALRKYLDLQPDAPDAAFLRSYIKPTS